jgi:hypothetical protein
MSGAGCASYGRGGMGGISTSSNNREHQCAYERPAIAENHAAPNDEIGSAIQVRLVRPKLRRTNPGLMYKLGWNLLHNHLDHLLHEFCSWRAEDDYGDERDSAPSSELLHELPGNGSPPHILNEGEAVSQVGERLKVWSS